MATISATELFGRYPLPGADVLRLMNDIGFGLAGGAGMIAAGLSVFCLSVQGHRVGVFGSKARFVGVGVGIVLLASLAFVPIVALLAWVAVMAIRELRADDPLDDIAASSDRESCRLRSDPEVGGGRCGVHLSRPRSVSRLGPR